MQLNIEESETGVVSYETLLNWIMDYLSDEGVIYNNRTAAKYVWQILNDICKNQLQMELGDLVEDLDSSCARVMDVLKAETQWDSIIKDVPSVIENRAITFDKNLDKICFIIDRDKESFVSKDGNDQYSYVLEMCKTNGYGFYLSNPCFEFWILLHFDEVHELDLEKLLENPKVTAQRRYTEHELRKLLPGYSKSRYSVDCLIKNIEKAIENEKSFCEDEVKLAHSIGSRVGLLIRELQE